MIQSLYRDKGEGGLVVGKLSHDTMNCIVTGGWLGWLGVSRYSRVYRDKGKS